MNRNVARANGTKQEHICVNSQRCAAKKLFGPMADLIVTRWVTVQSFPLFEPTEAFTDAERDYSD